MKNFTNFCQVLKETHAKENWFFFLPHGVYMQGEPKTERLKFTVLY